MGAAVVVSVLFVGGKPGNFPLTGSDLPSQAPTGLSENLGNGKGEGKERGKGRVGETPTGFCLKYHPGSRLVVDRAPCCRTENSIRTRRQLYQSLFSPLHVGYTRRIIVEDDANTNLYDV